MQLIPNIYLTELFTTLLVIALAGTSCSNPDLPAEDKSSDQPTQAFNEDYLDMLDSALVVADELFDSLENSLEARSTHATNPNHHNIYVSIDSLGEVCLNFEKCGTSEEFDQNLKMLLSEIPEAQQDNTVVYLEAHEAVKMKVIQDVKLALRKHNKSNSIKSDPRTNLSITIDAEGVTWIQDIIYSDLNTVRIYVTRFLATKSVADRNNITLVLNAEKNTPLDRITEIMELAKEFDIQMVLATNPK